MSTITNEIRNFLTTTIGFRVVGDNENVLTHALQTNGEIAEKYIGPVSTSIKLNQEDEERGLNVQILIVYSTWDSEKFTKILRPYTVFNGFVGAEKDINVIMEMTLVNDFIEAALSGDPMKVVEVFRTVSNLTEDDILFEKIIEDAREKMIAEIASAYGDMVATHSNNGVNSKEAADIVGGLMATGLESMDFETLRIHYFEAKAQAANVKANELSRMMEEDDEDEDDSVVQAIKEATDKYVELLKGGSAFYQEPIEKRKDILINAIAYAEKLIDFAIENDLEPMAMDVPMFEGDGLQVIMMHTFKEACAGDEVIEWITALRYVLEAYLMDGIEDTDADDIDMSGITARINTIYNMLEEDECDCEECHCHDEERDPILDANVEALKEYLKDKPNPEEIVSSLVGYLDTLIESNMINRVEEYDNLLSFGEKVEKLDLLVWFAILKDRLVDTEYEIGEDEEEAFLEKVSKIISREVEEVYEDSLVTDEDEEEEVAYDNLLQTLQAENLPKANEQDIEFEFDEISLESLKSEIESSADPKDYVEDIRALLAGAIPDEEDRIHVLFRKLITKEGFDDDFKLKIRGMVDGIQ